MDLDPQKPYLLERLIAPVSRVGKWIAMTLVVMMMGLITADVLLRYSLSRPISGAVEVIELMMVAVVFLGMAYATSQGSNVVVTVLLTRLPQRVQAVLGRITGFLSLVIVVLITWRSCVRAVDMWQSGRAQTTGLLLIPIFPFLLLLAFGTAVLCLVLLVDLIHGSREVKQ